MDWNNNYTCENWAEKFKLTHPILDDSRGNRIYNYFLVFIMILISFKVFFIYTFQKSAFKSYLFMFIGLLIVQLANSYLLFCLSYNFVPRCIGSIVG